MLKLCLLLLQDPAAFPNPTAIDPERAESAYILLGLGLHYCFGARLTWSAILATVKTIFKLKNLRRDPGRGGQFSRVTQTFADGLESHLYLDQSSAETPAPVNLHILVRFPIVFRFLPFPDSC